MRYKRVAAIHLFSNILHVIFVHRCTSDLHLCSFLLLVIAIIDIGMSWSQLPYKPYLVTDPAVVVTRTIRPRLRVRSPIPSCIV